MDTILWRFILYHGHEFCQLSRQGSEWHMKGISIFMQEQTPCCLSYKIACDAGWNTLSASVEGWTGKTKVSIQLRKSQNHRWWMNEIEVPGTAGCTDLDLNFSPSTNTIPMRRLNLEDGKTGDVRAAWLRFPDFTLEPLDQRYHRLDDMTYRYESANGSFVADLRINPVGFVIDYPGIWIAESGSDDQ